MNPMLGVKPPTRKFMGTVPIYCITTDKGLSSADSHGASSGDMASKHATGGNNMSGLMRNP